MENNITINLIDKLYEIATDKNKTDYQKAFFMYKLCSYNDFINYYNTIKNSNKSVELKAILNTYKYLEEYNIINNKIAKNTLNIKETNELDLMINIIKSNMSEINKAIYIYKLYKNKTLFSTSLKSIIDGSWHEENDEKIIFIYHTMKNWELNGIKKEADYYLKTEKLYDVSTYSLFIVKKFIDTPVDKLLHFYTNNGIDKQIFEYAVSVVNEIDIDLYKNYLEKVNLLEKYNLKQIDMLYNCIKTNKNPDGSNFTIWDFLKNIPFQDTFSKRNLTSFIQENRPNMLSTFLCYLGNNKINASSFELYNNLNNENDKVIINGREITEEDYSNIINYINDNGLIPNNITVRLVRERYLNNELELKHSKPKLNNLTVFEKEQSRQNK